MRRLQRRFSTGLTARLRRRSSAADQHFERTAAAFRRECEEDAASIPAAQREGFEQAAEAVLALSQPEKEYLLYLVLTSMPLARQTGTLDAELILALPGNALAADVNLSLAGGSVAAAPSQPRAEAAQPAAPEAKKAFDVELVSFDAGKKIAIIKEVKALLGLGLKEAKELVEKGGAVLKTGLPPAEAEALRDKLVAAGCVVNLK